MVDEQPKKRVTIMNIINPIITLGIPNTPPEVMGVYKPVISIDTVSQLFWNMLPKHQR
jgi:hypothetical protein